MWGIDAEELKTSLAAARYDALAKVDLIRQDPAECLAIAPEAPYYLALVFDSLQRPADGQRLMEVAWGRSPSPWREEAGIQLAQRALSDKDYDRAALLSRQVLASGGPMDTKDRTRRILVEALYWNKDDTGTLREAALLPSANDPEVLLFRAVSSLRLGLAPAHDLVMELFLRQKTSSLHGRAYTFIAAEPKYLQLFSAAEQNLLAGKYGLVQGTWAKAIASLEKAFAALDPSLLSDGVLVEDLGSGYIYGSAFAQGARFMDGLATHLTGQARVDSLEQAGKLYRRARDYPAALRQLAAAASAAVSPQQRDRISWYVVDILLTQSPPDLAARIAAEAAGWSDPTYFSDLFEGRIAALVAEREWKSVATLWSALETHGPDGIRAQLSYLLARAWQEGFVIRLPGSPPVTARALFADAARRDPSGYYGILSASMLGELPDKAVPAADAAATDPAGAPVSMDAIAAGLFRFGLSGSAYSRLWALRDTFTDAQLMDVARLFAAAGDLRSSLYFAGAAARRGRLTRADLQVYYPQGYSLLIGPLAAGADIAENILYGLVREESYFDADIVSSAGAIGLSQLMPATAAQVAKSLRMVDPNLTDPTTNLTIGVHHFKDLLGSASSTTKALLAYNAGLTRVRQWERAAPPRMPADLFVETVPIAETRGYIRKILVSAVMYAFLYHDADPREAALQFFLLKRKALEPSAASAGKPLPRPE